MIAKLLAGFVNVIAAPLLFNVFAVSVEPDIAPLCVIASLAIKLTVPVVVTPLTSNPVLFVNAIAPPLLAVALKVEIVLLLFNVVAPTELVVSVPPLPFP